MRIEFWKIIGDSGPFIAPEIRTTRLCGEVYGHLLHEDGHILITSYIISFNGRTVTTASGSVYELGYPDPEYIKWCQDNGHHIPDELKFPKYDAS